VGAGSPLPGEVFMTKSRSVTPSGNLAFERFTFNQSWAKANAGSTACDAFDRDTRIAT
jgi:hypothetical protein